jgi:hypothetical protein|tara:strand:- start:1443 stop:1838 length:396 start_codon:yes stop_codon:yes gene_type:complete
MAKSINDVIYSKLSNDGDVSAIVGTKIYPYLAIENIKYDYIVYEQTGVEPTDCKDGASTLDTVLFNIEMYSKTPSDLEDLSTKVRTVLDRFGGTVETIVVQSIQFTGEDSGYADEDRVFMKIQQYRARIEK